MVILTMYILVAVPLALVNVFNNNLYAGKFGESNEELHSPSEGHICFLGFLAGPLLLVLIDKVHHGIISGDNRLFFVNPSQLDITWVKETDERNNICPEDKIESKFTLIAIVIDCLYSLGLLSLALSPWAYIQSTKSFADKLWAKPIRKVSKWSSKKVRQSVRARQNRGGAGGRRAPPRAAPPGSTGGYTTVQKSSTVTGTVSTGVTSTTISSFTRQSGAANDRVVNGESALVAEESVVNGESSCLMAEEV